MGKKEKLVKKLYQSPRSFTFDDAASLLKYCSYSMSNKGRASGSRVMFISTGHEQVLLHKPHPQKELKGYQVKQLIQILEQEDLI